MCYAFIVFCVFVVAYLFLLLFFRYNLVSSCYFYCYIFFAAVASVAVKPIHNTLCYMLSKPLFFLLGEQRCILKGDLIKKKCQQITHRTNRQTLTKYFTSKVYSVQFIFRFFFLHYSIIITFFFDSTNNEIKVFHRITKESQKFTVDHRV